MALSLLVCASLVRAWDPLPVADDPLVRMPGTQPGDGVALEASGRCYNCHDGYDGKVDIGAHFRGSMMAQAARDPFFWAAVTVAAQDSIWQFGRPNATDLCLRCHLPGGWVEGRSEPTNGSAMLDSDFDGVSCDVCHRAYDPHFEATAAGEREGSDWLGYWDESGNATPSAAELAAATLLEDRAEAAALSLFNGNALYGVDYRPAQGSWSEAAGGQYFLAAVSDKRGPFADATPKHKYLYSRFHRSRYFCGTCHDVSNPALANAAQAATAPGDGTTVLASESQSAHSYGHVERTFSEFLLSSYGVGAGAAGLGPFAPESFDTRHPGNLIASCQDCHMPATPGFGCNKAGAPLRPDGSVAHPGSPQPLHDLTGANYLVPYILASTVVGSPNYDATNAALLSGREAELTMNLTVGDGLHPGPLLAGANRALATLARAAAIEALSYDAGSGALSFRVQNQTGHKLLTGYPEGRRLFVNIRVYKAGAVVEEINPYDSVASTLRGLPTGFSPSSPALGTGESHRDDLVYEVVSSSSLTGESHSFHFALADGRYKDNRIPPLGFRIDEAAARLCEPVTGGSVDTGLYSAAEYTGGYDLQELTVASGADGVEVTLYYQTTTREYVEFLRDEVNGDASSLGSPTPSGEGSAYVAQSDGFFSALAAWGDTIWALWDHNRAVPGAAPIEVASATWGTIGDPCAQSGSDGQGCEDGDLCTLGDTCSGGSCSAGSPVICTALGQCHDAGVCNPATGVCSNPEKTGMPACDDGDGCTSGEFCSGGSCGGGTATVCTALGQCHDAGTCDPDTGVCSNPVKAGTPACDDGDGCTSGEFCSGGSCGGGTVTVCTALGQCHDAGTCDPATGLCSNPVKAGTPACDDGDGCTSGEFCSGGSCGGGTATVCTALSQCHDAGTCEPATGLCSNPVKAGTPACDDGDGCTSGEFCSGGSCGGGAATVCTALGPCHEAGVCDPATGLCSNPVKAGTPACDDGNGCTTGEYCSGGACGSGTAIVCVALSQCHDVGVCDPDTGACSNPAKTGTPACDDGDGCTSGEFCSAGSCGGGAATVCIALDECHLVGQCDPSSGLCSSPSATDGSACSLGSCQAGVCLAPSPMDAAVGDQDAGSDGVADAAASDSAVSDAAVASDGFDAAAAGAGGGMAAAGAGGAAAAGAAGVAGAAGGSAAAAADGAVAAGGDAASDAATEATSGASEGCGCRIAGATSRPAAPGGFAALLLLAALCLRRRRPTARPTAPGA
ncbi:MAG: hypothetical protein OEZ06_27820 [Myxococcales bacterium]|nr:hypothetical protein [Myxococcales bacterium]